MIDQLFFTAPNAVAAHDPGGKSRSRWPAGSVVNAVFSECGCYRYELSEIWNPNLPLCMWVMMNPSVAGKEWSDPSLTRTGNFSRAWGFGGQLIGNMHGYRATDSKRLLTVADPVGPGNDVATLRTAARAKVVILAYGQPPKRLRGRSLHVVQMLEAAGVRLAYLRLAKDGTPMHPLYLPANLMPMPWPGPIDV